MNTLFTALFLRYIFTNVSTLSVSMGDSPNKGFGLLTSESTLGNGRFDVKGGVEVNYDNVLSFAEMSNVMYSTDENKTEDISRDNWSVRAYLFSNDDFSVNVIGIKGTSLAFTGGNYSWSDKLSDNMLFSCCFYKETNLFRDRCVSDRTLGKTCSESCYKDSMSWDTNYLSIARSIIETLKASDIIDFQDSQVIFTGHSLGGVVASYLGLTYDKLTVTFEAPGDHHYFQRAGILRSSSFNANKIYHFGHDADPIFKGTCHGKTSWCYLGGYIMKTKCHIGWTCEYPVQKVLGIRESIFTHRLGYVIQNVLKRDEWNKTLPPCYQKRECRDCEQWSWNDDREAWSIEQQWG